MVQEHRAKPAVGDSAETTAGARSRSWQLVKLVAVGVLIAVALAFEDLLPWQKILDPRLLLSMAVAAFIVFFSLSVNAWRHAVLVREPRAPWVLALKSVVLSAGLNLVIPGRLAELVKVTYLRQNLGIRTSHGLTAIVVERIFDVIVLGAISVLALASNLLTSTILLPLVAVGLLLALLAAPRFLGPVERWASRRQGRLSALLSAAIAHYRTVAATGRLPFLLLTTVLTWATLMLACIVFFWLQPYAEIGVWQACLVFVAINAAMAVPGPPAGVGLFQVAVGLVLVPNGVDLDLTILLGIALQIALWLTTLILAPIILVRDSTGVAALLSDARKVLKSAKP